MARTSPEHALRTFKALNLHLVDEDDCISGVWPVLEPSYSVPDGLTSFLPSQAKKHPDDFVHFYIEDYRFERLWTEPERYVDVLSRYAGMIMPDFSTYINMPVPMQLWNMYRSRALASFYQRCGIDVIPNLVYADERTYGPAFSGLPIGGTYCTCNIGILRDEEARHYFFKGLMKALETVRPDVLLVYGNKMDVELPCDVVYYKNDNMTRVRKNVPYIPASERKGLPRESDAHEDDVSNVGNSREGNVGDTFTISGMNYDIPLMASERGERDADVF